MLLFFSPLLLQDDLWENCSRSHQLEYSDWVEQHNACPLQRSEEKKQSHESTQWIGGYDSLLEFHRSPNPSHIFTAIKQLSDASEAGAAVLRWLLYSSLTQRSSLINREAGLSAPHRGLKQSADSARSRPIEHLMHSVDTRSWSFLTAINLSAPTELKYELIHDITISDCFIRAVNCP